MARDSSGTYSAPAGNPVVSGTAIESTWANGTITDIADELTNSLDRNGRGAMLAAFKAVNGTVSAPGVAFSDEVSSGLYRVASGDIRISVLGTDVVRFLSGTGLQLWNGSSWDTVEVTTGGLDNVVEDTTPQLGGSLDVNGQSIVSASNGAITITPNGTGDIILDGQKWPQADGTANQILKTNGSGQIAWTSSPTFSGLTVTSSITFSGATVANGGTVTTVDINGGTVDGVVIGGSSAAAGTFTTATTTTSVNTNTVSERTAGSGVTIDGVLLKDGGGTFTTVDINGGTIDGTAIGNNTASTGKFSNLTVTGSRTLPTTSATTGSTFNVDASVTAGITLVVTANIDITFSNFTEGACVDLYIRPSDTTERTVTFTTGGAKYAGAGGTPFSGIANVGADPARWTNVQVKYIGSTYWVLLMASGMD